MTKVICQDCDFAGTTGDIKRLFPDIPDLASRVLPDDLVPVGECPKCQALLYSARNLTAEDFRQHFGHWGENPDHPVSDWAAEAKNNDTRMGYWEWVAARESDE